MEVQEDFLSFDADLVAEQLTYMDAVSRRPNGGVKARAVGPSRTLKGHRRHPSS